MREGRTREADSSFSTMRARHASRLRYWLRWEATLTRTEAPRLRAKTVQRSAGPRTAATRIESVALVDARFACCPPGPPGVEYDHSMSAAGTQSPFSVRSDVSAIRNIVPGCIQTASATKRIRVAAGAGYVRDDHLLNEHIHAEAGQRFAGRVARRVRL